MTLNQIGVQNVDPFYTAVCYHAIILQQHFATISHFY
jgi:hypothetical protein